MSAGGDAILMIAVLLGAWAVPVAVVRGVVPLAEKSVLVAVNYRGRRLPVALGVVWLAWGLWMLPIGALAYAEPWRGVLDAESVLAGVPGVLVGVFLLVGSMLVLGAFALGLVDDIFDAGEAKGLRGHLRMLQSGRLSTGMLKLFGVAMLAATASFAWVHASGVWRGADQNLAMIAGSWTAGTVLIAASSNSLNLLDLRPGRALKGYAAAAAIPVAVYSVERLTHGSASSVFGLFALLAMVYGPVFAVWRFDLSEGAMLGDAGSNPMGAFVGLLWLVIMPPYAVIAAATFAVALNLLAERVSFSAIIERVALLRWLDGLGRLPAEVPQDVASP